VTVKTIVDYQKYSSEVRERRVARLRMAEALLLMIVPIAMTVIIMGAVIEGKT
jgi:hypothetical protein